MVTVGAEVSTVKPLLVAWEPLPPTATTVWAPSAAPAGTVTENPDACPAPPTVP